VILQEALAVGGGAAEGVTDGAVGESESQPPHASASARTTAILCTWVIFLVIATLH
jgi:hypothetical protein